MSWARSERQPGTTAFRDARATFPDQLGRTGADVSLVLNWGNPNYDNGDTPHSDSAVKAFGRFAAEMARRFDNMESLEVSNEFNGNNFVRGPIRGMAPRERAEAYVALLKSAATQVREVRPDMRIIGGAAHSIPAGYLWEVLDAGGAAYMDSLAIHPYTTPAEQFQRQLEVLRLHPDARDMPIEVTEFGNPNQTKAAAHLIRNYCQFALSGVTRAIWYPLNPRSDGMVPLLNKTGRVSTAGRAWRLVKTAMEAQPVRPFESDPFTYGCYFGNHTLVVWGEPRSVEISDGLDVLSATGSPIGPPHQITMEQPLIIRSPEGLPNDAVTLGPHGLVADSYHQFTYNGLEDDAFERFAERDGTRIDLETRPGQEARGRVWTPYLGYTDIGVARLGPEALRPAIVGDTSINIVQEYTAPNAQLVDIDATFNVAQRSDDGILVEVRHQDTVLYSEQGKGPHDINIQAISLAAGDQLRFVVGPGATARGDGTRYRIILREN
ncbi:MAG: hypothetical protein AAFQ22_13635 [Pseudomonadota bacterium]